MSINRLPAARPVADPVNKLIVTLHVDDEDIVVGTLAWSRPRRTTAFEYAKDFAARGLPISPFHLKPGSGVMMAATTPFGGLFGVFADSLPDGWGRLLVDSRIKALGGDPRILTPIDRLAIIGTRGMGALAYRPTRSLANGDQASFDIDQLASAAALIQAGEDGGSTSEPTVTSDVERLLGANGGSAGARPKILILRDEASGTFSLDRGVASSAGTDAWLVKFRMSTDPLEAGRIEHAVALMAPTAGISVPDTMTIVGASGNAHFAVRRFDRDKGRRMHVHTLAGLLNADFRQPSVDYEGFLQATRILTGRADEVEEAFRRALFNVMTCNKDDHAKNHAYLMATNGTWRLTPAYDVVPSEGPGGEHSMAIAGEGRQPGRADFIRLARAASIKTSTVETLIEQVATAVAGFADHAEAAGLGGVAAEALIKQFAEVRQRFAKGAAGRSKSL